MFYVSNSNATAASDYGTAARGDTHGGLVEGLDHGFGTGTAPSRAAMEEAVVSLVRVLVEWSMGVDTLLMCAVLGAFIYVCSLVNRVQARAFRKATVRAVTDAVAALGSFAVRASKAGAYMFISGILLPLLVGVYLDVATLKAFESTPAERLAALESDPVVFLLAHWLLGSFLWGHVTQLLISARESLDARALSTAANTLLPPLEVLRARYLYYDPQALPGPVMGIPQNIRGVGRNGRNLRQQQQQQQDGLAPALDGGRDRAWRRERVRGGGLDEDFAADEEQLNDLIADTRTVLRRMSDIPVASFAHMMLLHMCYTLPVLLFGVLVPLRAGHTLTLYLLSPNPVKLASAAEVSYGTHADMQVPFELLMVHVVVPFLFRQLRYSILCSKLMREYMRAATAWLGMSELYREALEDNGPGFEAEAEAEAAPGAGGGAVPDNAHDVGLFSSLPRTLRYCLLLLGVLVGHSLLSSVAIYTPLWLGRTAVWAAGSSASVGRNDLYCVGVGVLLSAMLAYVATLVVRDLNRQGQAQGQAQVQVEVEMQPQAQDPIRAPAVAQPRAPPQVNAEMVARDRADLVRTLGKWGTSLITCALLGVVWVVVIPISIGLVADAACLVPFRTTALESPRAHILSCWGRGGVVLMCWTRLMVNGINVAMAMGYNPNDLHPQWEIWRRRLETVMRQGVENVDAENICRHIFVPIFCYLGDLYLIPYFVSRTLGAVLFTSSYVDRSLLVRYSCTGLLITRIIWSIYEYISHWISTVHADLMDRKYLVGRALVNNQPEGAAPAPTAPAVAPTVH